ncbi:DegV family protein with EDD domain [Psychromicrobium silvestre]|uniref:DegV family protein with EDD domain n=1 Tax=Psychromicrobium silvestre TaxID=1645614 RepID=A0A7Y9LRQ6_9MICC|nr:DegV family protein [Psychromicrobium silvestre]NYE94362.1 DegV family protein with EDD domain [Psychromicrobium silvestre]
MDETTGAFAWLRRRLHRPVEQARPLSPRVAVVTDSAAALPTELVFDRLVVVPMPVMVDGQIFGEGDEDLSAKLSLALAAGKEVKTSRPSPGQFERVYQSLADRGFDSVLSLHISGELSGTVEAARLATDRVSIPVQVLDSRTVAMAQGFGVLAALRSSAGGESLDLVATAAQRALDTSTVFFYVPSLEQLRRGGRIGAAASWLGTVLAIKPILSVSNGQVVPLERVRSSAKAIGRLDELVAAELSRRDQASSVAVHHFGNRSQAEALLGRLALLPTPPAEAVLSDLPAVLAAHVGLGVLAVVISARES